MKTNKEKIELIIKDLNFILINTEKIISQEELKSNEILLNCVLFLIIQISENANKITEEFKNEHHQLPWNKLKGLRNRVVHDYGNVNLGIVFRMIKIDLPLLLNYFEGLLDDEFVDKINQK